MLIGQVRRERPEDFCESVPVAVVLPMARLDDHPSSAERDQVCRQGTHGCIPHGTGMALTVIDAHADECTAREISEEPASTIVCLANEMNRSLTAKQMAPRQGANRVYLAIDDDRSTYVVVNTAR